MDKAGGTGKLVASIALAAVAFVVVAVAAGIATRNVPERHANIEDQFKYGSIGAEERFGVPYDLWLVLPKVFPQYLPNRPGEGYAKIGFIYETPTSTRPIGTSLREDPIARVGLNCAVCHTGTVRDAPGGQPKIYLGMPAQQFDIQSYSRFLFACAKDPKFNADTLIPAMQSADPNFSSFDAFLYRYLVIPRAHDALNQQAQDFAWEASRPPEGPGRVDTFNPYKQTFFHADLTKDDTIGTADLPSLWNQKIREGKWLHWDGNNSSVDERNKSAALGAGASPQSLDLDSLNRIADWIWTLPAPAFPKDKIDAAKAQAGSAIYQAQCASCHDINSPLVGQVTPISQIGTDPARLDSFTPELAQEMDTLGTGYFWKFTHFRKTDGYANQPLDGIWLRAPYLHNGSVPTMRDLLKPPDQRPKVFYRGYDVYDYQNMGFVSTGPDAEKAGVQYDTSLKGNGNGGHVYGTTLSPTDVDALVEYMKTL